MLLVVRLKYDRRPVWLAAFAAVLFAPTIFFNSTLWGQCDAIHTTFLLTGLYCLLRRWPGRALLFFSIAFTFKVQAVFLLPLFFVLWAKGELPLRYFLLLPVVYLALCLPVLLAGRPLYDLLTIYLDQANTYQRLTSSAPNLYQWLPDNVPFALPYMHERYSYAADCIAIVYGFYFPRRFLAAVTISLFSYFPFLFNDMTVIRLPYLALLLAIVLVVVLRDLCKDLYLTSQPGSGETVPSPASL